jgi:Na+-driven multidrug efflux pump
MGAGLVATVALDVLLIPRYEAVGAAAASAVAYATSTVVLVWLFALVSRDRRTGEDAHRLSEDALPLAEGRPTVSAVNR